MGGRRDTERQGEQIKEHCPFFPTVTARRRRHWHDDATSQKSTLFVFHHASKTKDGTKQNNACMMGPAKTEQVCTGPSSLPVTVSTPGYMTAAGCSPETRRAGGRECEAVDNGQSPLRVYSQIPLSAALQEQPVQTDPSLSLGSSFKTCSTAPLWFHSLLFSKEMRSERPEDCYG